MWLLFIEHIFSNLSHTVDFESSHLVNSLRVCGLWSFDGLQPSIYVMVAEVEQKSIEIVEMWIFPDQRRNVVGAKSLWGF